MTGNRTDRKELLPFEKTEETGHTQKTTDTPLKNLRIFAALPNSPWCERNLSASLAKFGEVIKYTWDADSIRNDPQWHTHSRQNMGIAIYQQVQKTHAEKPIDVFFGCLSGRLISSGIIRAITGMGIPSLNLAMEDHTEFFGNLESTGFSGSVDIAGAFTLNWTTDKDAVDKYRRVGANVIFLPPGDSPGFCKPKDVTDGYGWETGHTWEQRLGVAFSRLGFKISPVTRRQEKPCEMEIPSSETLHKTMLKRYNGALEKYPFAEFPGLNAYLEQIVTFPHWEQVVSHYLSSRTVGMATKTPDETGNKKVILFLSVFPRVDMAKKADALLKTGKYRTILLCAKTYTGDVLDYMNEFYEEIYQFTSWPELLCYLIELTPDVIISRTRDQIATLAVIFGNAPVIINLYDMLTGVKTDNMLAVEAERFCFMYAAGVMHKSRPNAIDKYVRPFYTVKAPVLHFYPFCWERYFAPGNIKKLSEDDGIPRLVYTGIVTLSNTCQSAKGHDYLVPLIEAITNQNMYCHIYYNPETGVRDDYYREYFDLAEKNPYFIFHSPLPSDKLNLAIAQYDYGFIIHDIRGTRTNEIECDISTANKVFTYLEAGLPIIAGNTFKAVADFVEEHKIGIVVDPADISVLSKTLQSLDYKELKRNVMSVRNSLSINNNIYKLDHFIESVLKKN